MLCSVCHRFAWHGAGRSGQDIASHSPASRVHALVRRVAGDDRGVDCADRDARHPVRMQAMLRERLVGADMVGAERPAALQHQRNGWRAR